MENPEEFLASKPCPLEDIVPSLPKTMGNKQNFFPVYVFLSKKHTLMIIRALTKRHVTKDIHGTNSKCLISSKNDSLSGYMFHPIFTNVFSSVVTLPHAVLIKKAKKSSRW